MTVRARRALAAGVALAVAVLFALYLRESESVAVGSDGGAIALQAWDMLHGNLLLHGWAMSDVSFYSTELPQYMLLESLRGLSPDVVHLGGAMTYTILVVLAGLVAKGRATGREAAVRALIAVGIMLAPAAGFGAGVLLLTPDHLGSTVPVLLAWLVVDRCEPRPFVPVAVGALLTWGLVADSLVGITAVAPLVVVCAVRVGQRAPRRSRQEIPRRNRGQTLLRSRERVDGPWWFEPSLAAAALAAVGAAALVSAFIRASGGFVLRPVGTRFAGLATMPHHAFVAAQGILEIFGAAFSRGQPVNLIFSGLHLVGVGLFVAAFCIAVRRFLRPDELIVPVLAVAIALNLILYVHGNYAQSLLSTREISEVLPLGAVLAGRVMAGPVMRVRIKGRNWLMPALGAALACYAAVLVVYSAQRPVPANNQSLAGWLVVHHLTGGLAADYWLADGVTMDSGDQAKVRQVSISHGTLAMPYGWGFSRDWYTSGSNEADFVVTAATPGTATWRSVLDSARNTFGPPARTYSFQQYTVLVWGKNVLAGLH